ncbi:hypothetical protein ABT340_39800 [Streptosporangium sp. NPDC000239]|uniref:hypothetical protein n=1 Tax=Streptosporangium sp. NPDC000239 TaxID=3154248 RepID=UPI00332278CF
MIVEDGTGREIDLRDDDRDLDPPDESEPPLDLAEVEDAYQVVVPTMAELGRSGERLADAIPLLLAELRTARERLAGVTAMPAGYRYAAISTLCPDPDDPDNAAPSAEAALAEVPHWKRGKALRRTVYLGPWEEISAEAPF